MRRYRIVGGLIQWYVISLPHRRPGFDSRNERGIVRDEYHLLSTTLPIKKPRYQ